MAPGNDDQHDDSHEAFGNRRRGIGIDPAASHNGAAIATSQIAFQSSSKNSSGSIFSG